MDPIPVPLVKAAQMLRFSYQKALNHVLRGELKGWQDENRKWFVHSNDIKRFSRMRREETEV